MGVQEKQKVIEELVGKAFAQPSQPMTIAEFKRKWDEIARADGYLNDFHREHSERLKASLSKQPKATPEESLAHCEQINRGSNPRKS